MQQTPLFDRLGGRDGINAVLHQVLVNHFSNPAVSSRFHSSDMSQEDMLASATEFFCTGLSGVETYAGGTMAETHRGMNISEAEFVAVLDDILAAMESQGAPEREQIEVLGMLYGMKGDIVRQ